MDDLETIEVSQCHEAPTEEREHNQGSTEYCTKCGQQCATVEICAYCHGTGEIETMEEVYPGDSSGVRAPTGTGYCHCPAGIALARKQGRQ